MAAEKAGAGVVGDLVLFQAVRGQQADAFQIHAFLLVIFGQGKTPGAPVAFQRRALFQGQAIGRDMLRFQGKGIFQRGQPVGRILSRQAPHEVQPQIAAARGPQMLHCPQHVGAPVRPPQQGKETVVHALHAHGDAVDARSQIGVHGPRASRDSGLASMLISAPAARWKCRSIRSSTAAWKSGGSRLGVPPPKKTLSTGRLPRRAAQRSSSRSRLSR